MTPLSSDSKPTPLLSGEVRLRTLVLGFLMSFSLLVAIPCADAEAGAGREIQEYLVNSGALSSYMSDFVDKVGRDLAGGSIRVNQAYRPDAVNVYIADASIVDPSRLNDLGVPEVDDAVALEEVSIIIIDDRHLKKLVSLSLLFWEYEWSMHRAMAELELRGLSALRRVWDPSENRALTSDEVQHWRIAFRGAVGFLLAHELGHIKMGESEPAQIRKKHVFRSRRERDIHWACPELVDQRAAQHRSIESRADDYALNLLRARSGGRSPGRYEVGSEWYFSVLLERSFMEGLGRIEDFDRKPDLKRFMEQRYAPIQFSVLHEQLRAKAHPRKGPVSAFYPRTHPSALARLSLSLDLDPTMVRLAEAWAERMRRECASLRPQ